MREIRAAVEFIALATGKLGYAWDRVLLYGKGGGEKPIFLTEKGRSVAAAILKSLRSPNAPLG
jgi:hypothetical protein